MNLETMSRVELIHYLEELDTLILKVEQLNQEKLQQLKSEHSLTPELPIPQKKQLGLFAKIVIGLVFGVMLTRILSMPLQQLLRSYVMNYGDIPEEQQVFGGIAAVVVIFLIFLLTIRIYLYLLHKKEARDQRILEAKIKAVNARNEEIRKENEKIEPLNEEIRAYNQLVSQKINNEIYQYESHFYSRYPKFPSEYSDRETRAFFLQVLQDYRANSMGEAAKLYKEELHRMQVLQNQERIIDEQQKTNNIVKEGMDSINKTNQEMVEAYNKHIEVQEERNHLYAERTRKWS